LASTRGTKTENIIQAFDDYRWYKMLHPDKKEGE